MKKISKIIITDIRVPQYTFCENKYLLNLPGIGGWSFRLKYLFLMKSMVINIALRYKYNNSKPQDKWVQLLDSYFIPGEDYIEIEYVWGEKFTKNQEIEAYKKVRKQLIKVYNYYESHPEEYAKIVKSGYEKAKKITQGLVYDTVYKLIKKNSTYTQKLNL